MNSAPPTPRLGPEFDAFLFAQVGADGSGLPLSVVSVLARLNLDPWHEAARLASLSTLAATQQLVSILRLSPNASLKSTDILSVATRLVAMLPRPAASPSPSLRGIPVSTGSASAQLHANWLFLAVNLIFVVASQLLVTHFLHPHADARFAIDFCPFAIIASAPDQMTGPARFD